MAPVTSRTELYGRHDCPYTEEAREHLEWQGGDYIEYDIGTDPDALRRFLSLAPGNRLVPLLVRDGQVVQIGWRGRGCIVQTGPVPEDRVR